MPSYFPENNTPLPTDTVERSLQKAVDLIGGAAGGSVLPASSDSNEVLAQKLVRSLSAASASGEVVEEAPEDGIIYGRKDADWVDLTAPANLQVRRGTAAEVAAITPLIGEPVWATDSKRLYIGDGVSAGGYIINPAQFVAITDTEVDNAVLLPVVSVTLPAQSSWALLLYLKVQLAEDATEVSLQIGRVVEGSSEYSALPNGVLADGYWRYYSETGITPTQSTMTDLEVVVSGAAGETVVVTQYFVAINTTAQSATIGLYGIADQPSATLGGYLKAERIA